MRAVEMPIKLNGGSRPIPARSLVRSQPSLREKEGRLLLLPPRSLPPRTVAGVVASEILLLDDDDDDASALLLSLLLRRLLVSSCGGVLLPSCSICCPITGSQLNKSSTSGST